MATFVIRKTEFRSLSNFYKCKVVIFDSENGDRTYESGEHCFHGEKYFRLSKNSSRPEILKQFSFKFLSGGNLQEPIDAKRTKLMLTKEEMVGFDETMI